jgi:prolyl oligopeptidase
MRPTPRLQAILFVLCSTAAAIAAADAPSAKLSYPEARRSDQVDTYFGAKVADPYRWMEDIDSPETRAWVTAEQSLTRNYLDAIPGRERIQKRLAAVWNYPRWSSPEHHGANWFFTRNDGLQNQPVLYVTRDPAAAPRVLLDPNTLSSDGTVALKRTAFSDDGRYMAYGTSKAGSDWETWQVIDVTGKTKPADELHWVKFSNISWTRDGKGFFYSRFDAPSGTESLKDVNEFPKLYFHRFGAPQAEDTLVFENRKDGQQSFSGEVTEDGHYLIITVFRGTGVNTMIMVKDLSQPKSDIQTLIGEFKASYDFLGNKGAKLFFKTDADAPKNRVVAIDLKQSQKIDTVIPESGDSIASVHLIGGNFVVVRLRDAHSTMQRYAMDGKSLGEVTLPGIGTVDGVSGFMRDTLSYFSFDSFTTPPMIVGLNVKSGETKIWQKPKIDFDGSRYETRQVFFTSRDGTRIPLFITAKKGMAQDGSNPTMLYGYGGFNISILPRFSPAVAVWLEQGGVWAVVTLRGGSEYGRAWHEAGMKTHKQNVFDDNIAAAEYLINEKYTSPQRLALRGGSNGGLLVAATELQRPELFAAAVPEVPVIDMLRFRDFTIGKAWESDYGSVDNEDEFKAMLAYAPRDNVKLGISYPPTLILTGDHDDRVFPAHSFKFAAAMQHAYLGSYPKLLRVESSAGHGAGMPTSKRIDVATDILLFVLSSMGLAHD